MQTARFTTTDHLAWDGPNHLHNPLNPSQRRHPFMKSLIRASCNAVPLQGCSPCTFRIAGSQECSRSIADSSNVRRNPRQRTDDGALWFREAICRSIESARFIVVLGCCVRRLHLLLFPFYWVFVKQRLRWAKMGGQESGGSVRFGSAIFCRRTLSYVGFFGWYG